MVDIITPRVQVVAVSSDMSPEEILKVFDDNGFSRLPVYNDDIDKHSRRDKRKGFSQSYGKITDIKSITKPILYTTPTTKISALLRQLQKQKSHIAIVIDEYGGTLGIVTLEDILEELVGEIWDEHDEVIEPIKRVGEKHIQSSVHHKSRRHVQILQINRNGKDYVSNTVSGWVIEELGRLPAEGDSFAFDNLEITVAKTDLKRVEEIEVKGLITRGDGRAGMTCFRPKAAVRQRMHFRTSYTDRNKTPAGRRKYGAPAFSVRRYGPVFLFNLGREANPFASSSSDGI